jgi:hypothetical protein
MTTSNPLFEGLSPEQLRLATTVEALAVNEGGETPDVIRSARVELWPGCTVLATIVDSGIPLDEPSEKDRLYGLDATMAGGEYVEELTVHIGDAVTSLALNDSETYGDDPAPDYAISSFFDRFPADRLAIAQN